MSPDTTPVTIEVVRADDPEIRPLIDALTHELAGGGYTEGQTFGYSVDQLQASGVHLVAARRAGVLIAIGGIEVNRSGGRGRTAELKRFYAVPEWRGTGVADLVITALISHGHAHGIEVVRLETGDKQAAALRFYRRHGFVDIDRFGPYVDSATSVCLEKSLESGRPYR